VETYGKALTVLIRRVCRSCCEDGFFEGNEIIPHWFGEIVSAEWADGKKNAFDDIKIGPPGPKL
jgi:hypothetical protein